MKVHVPFWAEEVKVFRNDVELETEAENGYLCFEPCKDGDEIRLEMHVHLRLVENKEDSRLVNLACGPISSGGQFHHARNFWSCLR